MNIYLTRLKISKILHKFNILKQNYNNRAASSLSKLYFYRMFKCFLIKLYAFENGVLGKNFGFLGPSLKMAGFQNRRPSPHVTPPLIHSEAAAARTWGCLVNTLAQPPTRRKRCPPPFLSVFLIRQSDIPDSRSRCYPMLPQKYHQLLNI